MLERITILLNTSLADLLKKLMRSRLITFPVGCGWLLAVWLWSVSQQVLSSERKSSKE